MATLHTKKAGQWVKSTAWKQLERELIVGLVALMLVIFLSGFAVGFGRGSSLWAWILAMVGVLVVTLLIAWLMKRAERRWEVPQQERIRRLRGAHAEALVAYVLQTQLIAEPKGLNGTGGWHIWCNVPLGDLGDADVVVIGPGGCFVVSVKSHLGLLTVGGNALSLNNRPTSDPWAADAVKQALRLRDRINAADGQAPPFVRGVLCVPHAALEPNVTPLWCGNTLVCNERTLIETLESHGNPIDRSIVLRLKAAVATLSNTPEVNGK